MKNVFFILLLFFANVFPSYALRGEGTEESPYEIADYHDFSTLCQYVGNHYRGKIFKLTKDIEWDNSIPWKAMGGSIDFGDLLENRFDAENCFQGILDGAGHQIRGVVLCEAKDKKGDTYVPSIFDSLAFATIKNLHFADCTLKASSTANGSFLSFLAYQCHFENVRIDLLMDLAEKDGSKGGKKKDIVYSTFGVFALSIRGYDAQYKRTSRALGEGTMRCAAEDRGEIPLRGKIENCRVNLTIREAVRSMQGNDARLYYRTCFGFEFEADRFVNNHAEIVFLDTIPRLCWSYQVALTGGYGWRVNCMENCTLSMSLKKESGTKKSPSHEER